MPIIHDSIVLTILGFGYLLYIIYRVTKGTYYRVKGVRDFQKSERVIWCRLSNHGENQMQRR